MRLDVDEAVGEASLALCRAARDWREADGEFSTYLYTVIRNALLKSRPDITPLNRQRACRRGARQTTFALPLDVTDGLGCVPDGVKIATDYFTGGYSPAEIAHRLGVCTATVRRRLARIADILRPELRPS